MFGGILPHPHPDSKRCTSSDTKQNLNILPSAGGPVSELASVMPGSEEDVQRQYKEAKAKVEKANKVGEHAGTGAMGRAAVCGSKCCV